MNHRLLPAAIALFLIIPACAAEAQDRVTYSRRWLELVGAEPAFASARPLFEAGDPAAIRELVVLVRGNDRLAGRLALLADVNELTGPLIDGLDDMFVRDPVTWGFDVTSLLEAIGPRRPEAVPLLVRICAD